MLNLNKQPHIFCDFDGTIAQVDVIDSLLENFAPPQWRDIEQEWKTGKIGSRECLTRQVALLNMSQFQLDQYLNEIEIDSDFPVFVKEMFSKGYKITIVSDGLDYAIQRILTRYHLNYLPVFSNHLQTIDERHWQLTFPHFKPECKAISGHCKCSTVKQHQSTHSILIGDGTSDFCAAEEVDMVFAKHKLISHCVQKNIAHYPVQNFSEIRNIFKHSDFIFHKPTLATTHLLMETY